jgi:ubiquinone/menaquinone biosynthesis C-methylase UbiE
MMAELKTHRDIVLMELTNIIKELGVTPGQKILEIGQGMDTQFREYFESLGLIYTATDTYIGSNNNGKERLAGEEYFYDSMEDLKSFKDNEFDFVFNCHAFEHCERPIDALREMRRVLKVGGKMIIVLPWCCKHHIIDADPDHIFVLNTYQMIRLLTYTKFGVLVSEQKAINWREQDFNLFVVGEKNEL